MEDQEPQEEGSEQPGHLAAKSPPSPEDLLAQDIANLWLAAPGYQVSSAVIWLHHQGESEAMQEMLFRNFQLPEEVGACAGSGRVLRCSPAAYGVTAPHCNGSMSRIIQFAELCVPSLTEPAKGRMNMTSLQQ